VDAGSAASASRFYRPQSAGVAFRMYPGLRISGIVGSTNVIQFDNAGSWTTIETVVLPSSPHLWIDTGAPLYSMRTYRVVDVGLAPVITSASTYRAYAGYPMNFQVAALSFPAITSYGATGLPSGLAINPATGLISGMPASEGVYPVTVSASSANGTGSAPLTLEIRSAMRPEMVAIAAGAFTLGSSSGESGRDADEGPTTQITLTQGFSIGVYEVTQAEFLDVTGSNPSFFTGDLTRPVEHVTYADATNYCMLLTARDRGLGILPATQAYRLPTEAEWEYAARAGTSTRFSFGDSNGDLGANGWYQANAGDTTHSVGGKAANPWNLRDTYGNCWEICSDWYGPYPGGSVTNPQGPASGTTRVIRGGSWFQNADSCRSANRDFVPPAQRFGDVGFRVVLAPVP